MNPARLRSTFHRLGTGEARLLIIIVIVLLLGILGIGAVLWMQGGEEPDVEPLSGTVAKTATANLETGDFGESKPEESAGSQAEEVVMDESTQVSLDEPIQARNPGGQIAERLEGLAGEDGVLRADSLPSEWLEALPEEVRASLEAGDLVVDGEPRLLVEGSRLQRWELPLRDAEGNQRPLQVDFTRDPEGQGWRVAKLAAVGGEELEASDALAIATAFLQSLEELDIESARGLVSRGGVSNAQLAGLCILFEEGVFEIGNAPLELTVARPGVQAFTQELVPGPEASSAAGAQLAFILHRSEADEESWEVVELSFDQALVDYAAATSAGDTYYIPLVESPQGGQSLALYFDFDEAELGPRARRQLQIVARLLEEDSERRLVISGHTDAKGTSEYNERLGLERARDVRDFLVAQGLPESQIEIESFGASRPRAANVTETGEDNPEGRQANRRAEIYLDF